jgi:TDG/mug DNA glycosylase family protein
MDRATVDVYERGAETYLRRPLQVPAAAGAFAGTVGPGALRLDLGCGPGRLTGALGSPVVAVDAAFEMVRRVTATRLRVQADLEALPFRRSALAGTWASKCLQHVPPERLPLALADLHRAMAVGGRLDLVVFEGEGTWRSDGDDDLPGRMFWGWPVDRLVDVVVGAGFVEVAVEHRDRAPVRELHVTATRGHTLADAVGPGMRLLTCGLNPSLVAADAGVPYARPGNRFWPAVQAAGLATVDRDQRRLLLDGGVGTTDLVKRASVAADELRPDELAAGLARVERLCAWLAPRVLYLVGLAGWRAVVDRRAEPGLQPTGLGGVPVYLAPSTSGRNAATRLETHVHHLERALAVAGRG